MRFARSLDAGETWHLDGEAAWSLQKPSLITSAHEDAIPLEQEINFSHPDFMMKSFGSKFVISYDRGKIGQGPYALPDLAKELVAYGYRREPFGIRAKLSSGEGQSWSEEIVRRDDGRTWDLGYPRMVQRSDGKLVTIYYYTTAQNPEQHIAATIWGSNLIR